MWVIKGAESKKWPLFCAQTTPSLSFCLISVQGNLKQASATDNHSI